MLNVKEASLSFQERLVFSQINLTIPEKKWVALLGRSGVGKSSLLRLIAGLTPKSATHQGRVLINHTATSPITYLPQTDSLLPWLNALENTLLGYRLRGQRKRNATIIAKAKMLLEQVRLAEFMYFYPHQLSGGMRQRVALVRTLLEDKPIILMDEPFSALDTLTRYELQDLATALLKDKTVLFITHDPIEALRLAHTIYIMHGEPATLSTGLSLESPLPRTLTHPEVINGQARLLTQIIQSS